MKIIFFGSSEFSLSALKACLAKPHQILLVITTPPQKQGRGLKELPTPIQTFSEENSLPFLAPETLKNPELLKKVQALAPELFVVSSYGKMIPSDWLKVPSILPLNVHPSLLPKHRGAAPINWPILLGETETGISITEVTPKLDAGDIFYQKNLVIDENQTAVELENVLAEKSMAALGEVFNAIQNNTLKRTPQDDTKSTYARKLVKEDGKIDWTSPAQKIVNQIRGLLPWPAAWTPFRNEPLQILKAKIFDPEKTSIKPGAVFQIHKGQGVEIQTGKGSLLIEQVKPAGKNLMSAFDFANGKRLLPGEEFGA